MDCLNLAREYLSHLTHVIAICLMTRKGNASVGGLFYAVAGRLILERIQLATTKIPDMVVSMNRPLCSHGVRVATKRIF
jgi:hypothetical protein